MSQNPGLCNLGLAAGSDFALVIKLGNLSFNTVSPSCLLLSKAVVLLAFYMLGVSHYVPAI